MSSGVALRSFGVEYQPHDDAGSESVSDSFVM
jgi:hypothetical protein